MTKIGPPQLIKVVDSNFGKKLPKKIYKGAKIGKLENGAPCEQCPHLR
jgi:hypothetical protein